MYMYGDRSTPNFWRGGEGEGEGEGRIDSKLEHSLREVNLHDL